MQPAGDTVTRALRAALGGAAVPKAPGQVSAWTTRGFLRDDPLIDPHAVMSDGDVADAVVAGDGGAVGAAVAPATPDAFLESAFAPEYLTHLSDSLRAAFLSALDLTEDDTIELVSGIPSDDALRALREAEIYDPAGLGTQTPSPSQLSRA